MIHHGQGHREDGSVGLEYGLMVVLIVVVVIGVILLLAQRASGEPCLTTSHPGATTVVAGDDPRCAP